MEVETMFGQKAKHIMLGAVLAVALVGVGRATAGVDLGDVLKGGAIGLFVKQFSRPLNDAINKVTLQHGVEIKQVTKVVPIVSVGKGGFAGAAQVMGEQADVDRVKAVAQLEGTFTKARFKVLIPIESEQAVSNIKRVVGVGVTAVIDIRL
jgi:hypothetical protein